MKLSKLTWIINLSLMLGVLSAPLASFADGGSDSSSNKAAELQREIDTAKKVKKISRLVVSTAATWLSVSCAIDAIKGYKAVDPFVVKLNVATSAGAGLLAGYEIYKLVKGDVDEDAPAKSVSSDLIAPLATDSKAGSSNGGVKAQ